LVTANAQLTLFTDEVRSSIEASWRDLSPPESRFSDVRFLEIHFLEHPLPLTAKLLLDSHRMVDYVLPTAIFDKLVDGLDNSQMRPVAAQILLICGSPPDTAELNFERMGYRKSIARMVEYLVEDQAAAELAGNNSRAAEDRALLQRWAGSSGGIDGLRVVAAAGSLQAFAGVARFVASNERLGQLILGEVPEDRWTEIAFQFDLAPLFARALRNCRLYETAKHVEIGAGAREISAVASVLTRLSVGDHTSLRETSEDTLVLNELILSGQTRVALPILRSTQDRYTQLVVLSLLASGIDPARGDLLGQRIALDALNDPELRRAAAFWLVRNPPRGWDFRRKLSTIALGLADEPMATLPELTPWRSAALEAVNAELARRGVSILEGARTTLPAPALPESHVPSRGTWKGLLQAALAHQPSKTPLPDETSLRARLLSQLSNDGIFEHVVDFRDPLRGEALMQLADRSANLRALFYWNPGALPGMVRELSSYFADPVKFLLLFLQDDPDLYNAVLEDLVAQGTTRLELGLFTTDLAGVLLRLSESAKNTNTRDRARSLLQNP
jgi:hypothetical protein